MSVSPVEKKLLSVARNALFLGGCTALRSAVYPIPPKFLAETTISQTNLTSMEMKEEVISSKIRNVVANDDPYDDKTPKEILTREYRIHMSIASDDTPILLHPFDLLRKVSTIANYLKNFKWLRSTVRFRVVLTAAPTVYGSAMVGVLPYCGVDAEYADYLEQISQSNASLLDLSSQTSVEYELPHLSPALYYNCFITPPEWERQWQVIIKPLFISSLDVTAPSVFSIQVYASFVNPETAGYMPAVFQSMVGYQDRPILSRIMSMVPRASTTLSVVGGAALASVGNMVRGGSQLFNTASTVHKIAQHIRPSVQPLMGGSQPATAPTNIKMTIGSDLSATAGTNTTDRVRLGDGQNVCGELPMCNTDHDITTLCSRTTLVDTWVFSTADENRSLAVSPYEYGTYTKYFCRMFKYWRGEQLMTLVFNTSQLVSAKVQITLFPCSISSLDPLAIGDLPTWIVSVVGTTSVTIPVPYLSNRPWKHTSGDDILRPNILVRVIGNIAVPLGEPATIFCMAFYSGGSDLQFAGLESAVPGSVSPSENAVFQSFVNDLPTRSSSDTTFDHPFQGGITSVLEIQNRFSSRLGATQYIYPFPLVINTWAKLFELDNFDYVANLYRFYYGEVQIKTMFTGGVSPSLLKVQVRNSKEVVGGHDYKSSNGVVVTEQSVWPVLEYTFPYLSEFGFDCVQAPNSMFGQKANAPTAIESYYLARTDNFSMGYVMPLPTYFLVPPGSETEPEAFFQSSKCLNQGFSLTTSTFAPYYDIGTFNIAGEEDSFQMDFSLQRMSGTRTFPLAIAILKGDVTLPGTFLSLFNGAERQGLVFLNESNSSFTRAHDIPRFEPGVYNVYFYPGYQLIAGESFWCTWSLNSYQDPDLHPQWSTPYKPV